MSANNGSYTVLAKLKTGEIVHSDADGSYTRKEAFKLAQKLSRRHRCTAYVFTGRLRVYERTTY